jgi:hypothetical protein
MVRIIATFDSGSIPDESIEHHCCIHEIFIACGPPPYIIKRLHLRHRNRPAPDHNTMAMFAVRAVTVHGNRSPITFNRDPVLFLIPQKR